MARTKAKTEVKRERGTGGLIKIKGCRYWYAQIYIKGKPRRISTKTPVKQKAQSVLRDLMTDTNRGVQFPGDLKKIFYGDLRNALLQNYVERGNRSLQTLSDGEETIWGLKALDEFFDYDPPEKCGVSLAEITTDAAREFAKKRAPGVSNSTINTSLSLLRRMLHIAHEDGKIQIVPKIRLLKENPARKGFLAREKFEELFSHMPPKLRPLITFLYYCGVRLGEALQIEWPQVDLAHAVIRIEDEQAKSGEARTVPLPDTLVEMLQQIEPKTGRVFVGTNLRKAWQKACAATGLGVLEEVDDKPVPRYSGLIVHDLRRSAIKNLMKAGVNERVAMAISGHKTRAVFDRYHIIDEADVVNAMRRMQDTSKQELASNSEKSVKALPEPSQVSE